MTRNLPRLILLLVCAAALAGCASVAQVKPVQPLVSGTLPLPQPGSIGQTFTSRFAGLEGVLVYLKPVTPPAEVTLRLYRGPAAAEEIRSSRVQLGANDGPTFYRFAFEPIAGSYNQDYYLQIETQAAETTSAENGAGAVYAGYGIGDAYTDGALYLNSEAQDAQLAFLLDYDTPRLGLGLLREGGIWLSWLLAALLVFVLPGWALLDAFWPDWVRLGWPEKLGLSAGAGLPLYPIFFLLTHRIGLNLGPLYAWLPATAAALWLIRRAWQQQSGLSQWRPWRAQIWPALCRSFSDGSLLLVVVIAAITLTRLWAMRELDSPLWHDSYEHTMIVQLLLDHGGLFANWQPYSPYYSLTVHFGFHAQTAVLAWIAGLTSVQAVLLNGQITNILALLALLPLALRLAGGSRWAGAGALIAAGLVSIIPAQYVNWGRFPQLAGQAILPATLWLTWDLFAGFRRSENELPASGHAGPPPAVCNRRFLTASILLGVLLAGMTLTYYRMAFFYAIFMLVWALTWAAPNFGRQGQRWAPGAVHTLVISLVTLLLLAPWFLQTQNSWLGSFVGNGMARATPMRILITDLSTWRTWQLYMPAGLAALAGLGLLLGIARRRWIIPALALWIMLVVGYSAGRVLQFPGANMLSNFSILIFVYLPVAWLVGYLAGEIAGWLPRRAPRLAPALLNLAALLIVAWTANGARQITAPLTSTLLTRPDLRAMEWIKANVPQEARFLVEGFTQYERSTAVGADGGWWIPLMTQRENTMPPQYTLMERPDPPDYTDDLVALVVGLEDHSPTSLEGTRLLCENRITHIYIGQMQGKIGYLATQLFAPADFLDHPDYKLVYHQDRVYIFELQPWVCSR